MTIVHYELLLLCSIFFFRIDQVDGELYGWDGMKNPSTAYDILVSCEKEKEKKKKGKREARERNSGHCVHIMVKQTWGT